MQAGQTVEFLRLTKVLEITGLSKTEVYRQSADGRFPKSRAYKHNQKIRFWLSTEVRQWQVDQLGDEFEGLLG